MQRFSFKFIQFIFTFPNVTLLLLQTDWKVLHFLFFKITFKILKEIAQSLVQQKSEAL